MVGIKGVGKRLKKEGLVGGIECLEVGDDLTG